MCASPELEEEHLNLLSSDSAGTDSLSNSKLRTIVIQLSDDPVIIIGGT